MKFHRQFGHGRQLLDHGFQPDKALAVRNRIFGQLLVQKGKAGRLAGEFAGGKGDEARKHPRLHPRNGIQRDAAFLEAFFEAGDIIGRQNVGDRFAIQKHGELRLAQQRGRDLLVVDDFVRLHDDNRGFFKGGAGGGRHFENTRIGDMHGAEKIGRGHACLFDAPEIALAVRDGGRFLFDLCEGLRIGLAHFHENVIARARDLLLLCGFRLPQRKQGHEQDCNGCDMQGRKQPEQGIAGLAHQGGGEILWSYQAVHRSNPVVLRL
ncbi:hypothetical protein D3C86_1428730 [compost metagenome]